MDSPVLSFGADHTCDNSEKVKAVASCSGDRLFFGGKDWGVT